LFSVSGIEFMDDDNLDILRSGDHLFYSFSTYILTIDYL